MKQVTLESKEFKRVLHNLHLENMNLTPKIQKRIIELSNQEKEISPALIKEMLAYGKI